MDMDEGSYEENIAKLDEEFKKPKANHKILRGIMKSTFEGSFYMLSSCLDQIFLCMQDVENGFWMRVHQFPTS